MNPYITIPLYCPTHDSPARPLSVSPDELNEASGYIDCDTCGQPMRPVRPCYIIEHPNTHELHMLAAETRTLYRLDGTPIQAPNLVNLWPIYGAVTSLFDWQDNPLAEHLRRYIVATLTFAADPSLTFIAGGTALAIRNWANNYGRTL